jgi:hypothetical protein
MLRELRTVRGKQTIRTVLLALAAFNFVVNEAASNEAARSQPPLAFIRNWAITTGAQKALGRSIAEALGFQEEMSGLQIAFTSPAGEGHIALVCDLGRKRLIFLAHLDAERHGLIWMTSEDGLLKGTAVRRDEGVQTADNAQFAQAFEAEKQFFTSILPEVSERSRPLNAPSCRTDANTIAKSI